MEMNNEGVGKIPNGDSGRPVRIVRPAERANPSGHVSMYDDPDSLLGDPPAFSDGYSVGEAKLTDSPAAEIKDPTFGVDENKRPITFARWADSVKRAGKTYVEVTHSYGRVLRVLGTPFDIIKEHHKRNK